ncbi:hypothetical protein [Amycolatopsis pithecellobii]|uniref:hypothetical protein n=1 Tax=Amycolatopsis pithecellobii TaxID=664692 RepID=UPI001AA068B7|nr:hypothetical protein [Amycolatopsis pithecellobii]
MLADSGGEPRSPSRPAASETAGKITNQINVVEGLEHAPHALRGLFTGENLGTQLVEIESWPGEPA